MNKERKIYFNPNPTPYQQYNHALGRNESVKRRSIKKEKNKNNNIN